MASVPIDRNLLRELRLAASEIDRQLEVIHGRALLVGPRDVRADLRSCAEKCERLCDRLNELARE